MNQKYWNERMDYLEWLYNHRGVRMFKQYQGTSEYHKAIQARKERTKALKVAKEQSKGIRYTTKGDFCHLAGKGLSYARS